MWLAYGYYMVIIGYYMVILSLLYGYIVMIWLSNHATLHRQTHSLKPLSFSVITELTSTSAPCPTFCTMEYRPVCDSNGQTHPNQCAFEVAACEARKLGFDLNVIKQGTC